MMTNNKQTIIQLTNRRNYLRTLLKEKKSLLEAKKELLQLNTDIRRVNKGLRTKGVIERAWIGTKKFLLGFSEFANNLDYDDVEGKTK